MLMESPAFNCWPCLRLLSLLHLAEKPPNRTSARFDRDTHSNSGNPRLARSRSAPVGIIPAGVKISKSLILKYISSYGTRESEVGILFPDQFSSKSKTRCEYLDARYDRSLMRITRINAKSGPARIRSSQSLKIFLHSSRASLLSVA